MLETSFEKEKTCRTCTKSNVELSSLFTKQSIADDVCFSDMIKACTMYTVQEDDELPHLICSECQDKVRVAYDFKKQCEESHRRLLNIIQSIKDAPIEPDKTLDSVREETTQQDVPEINSSLRKKSTRNASTKQHLCEKCPQIFSKLDQLKEHVRTEHKEPRHQCPSCSKEFIRLGHLKRHLTKVHESEDITKENTKEEVSVKIESQPEIVSSSTPVANIVTPDLGFDFGSDNDGDSTYHDDSESIKSVKAEEESPEVKINSDEITVTGLMPIIDEAPAKQATATIVEEKKENEEPIIKDEKEVEEPPAKKSKWSTKLLESNRKFQCDQCHKAFKRKSHLKQHILCHTKIKPYQCTICEKKFGRPDNLKVHMSNHGQKQFQCNSCDRAFGQAYLLKRHKDQTHSEEKPFLCSECGQRFVRNGDLAVHMRRHTGEKPYKCQYCNKGFTRSTEVYVHERYHTGEKRHVCSTCGKAFQRPYNLLVHVRTHTGERPYQCPHCPKNFAQCSDLKAHIRRHTGERYRCEQCGMGFIHVFVLNQHKFSVHGIEVQSRIKRVAKLSTDTP